MSGDIDHTSIPVGAGDASGAGEPALTNVFPTRDDALALALKIAGPKISDDAAV